MIQQGGDAFDEQRVILPWLVLVTGNSSSEVCFVAVAVGCETKFGMVWMETQD